MRVSTRFPEESDSQKRSWEMCAIIARGRLGRFGNASLLCLAISIHTVTQFGCRGPQSDHSNSKESPYQAVADSQQEKQARNHRFHAVWMRYRDQVVGSEIAIGSGRVFASNGSELAVDANSYQLIISEAGEAYILRSEGLRGSVLIAGPVRNSDEDFQWILENCEELKLSNSSGETDE